MELNDQEKLQLRQMLSTPWWKVLEKLVNSKIEEFDKQITVSAHDYIKVREKKYDELNLNGALMWWMSLVLKAPYDALNKEATDNMIAQMNESYRQKVMKLER